MTRNAVWALSNLCRGKNPPPDFTKVAPALEVLARLLFHNDFDVLADTCWALSYLADGSNSKVQTVIDSGVSRKLVELLMTKQAVECSNSFTEPKVQKIHEKVVSAALRAVGILVTGDDIQTQTIVNCSVLPCLIAILSSKSVKENLKKEACWIISNITAGNQQQVQCVIDANAFPVIIDLLDRGDYKTRKECLWIVANAASGGSNDQISYIVSQGAIPPLCDLLTVMDAKIVQVALSGLENILRFGETGAKETGTNPYAVQIEECYGLDKIEFLQSHENLEIYQKAFDIIERYFGSEDDADSKVAPQVTNEGQQFQFNPAPQQLQSHQQAGFQF